MFARLNGPPCTPSGQTTNALVGDSEQWREPVPSALAGGKLMVGAAAANECYERQAGRQTRTIKIREAGYGGGSAMLRLYSILRGAHPKML